VKPFKGSLGSSLVVPFGKREGSEDMPKKWDLHEVPAVVHQLYRQVLDREPDESGLVAYGRVLSEGEWSVRDAVRAMGHSDEYKQRFVIPFTIEDAVKACFRHFFAREADLPGLRAWEAEAVKHGIDVVVDGLVNSPEYSNRFGNDTVPH
jgi:phycobilisome core-membrane linker protein